MVVSMNDVQNPEMNSMHIGVPLTQNNVEAWYRRWENLVGRAHVGLYTIIEESLKEQHNVENRIECIIRGEKSVPRKNLMNEKIELCLVNNRENLPLLDYLRVIAHNLSI